MDYHLDEIGGMCPAQALGALADSRPFYFRARHGEWTLEVGPPGTEPDSDWHGFATTGDTSGRLTWEVAGGDDPTHGRMPEETVRALLEEHLGAL